MLLVAVEVSAVHVEGADKRGKQRPGLRASLVGGNVVDVEEHALGGVARARDLHRSLEGGIVRNLGQDVVHGMLAVHHTVLEDYGEDLEEVGLARAEEPADPRAVAHGVGLVVLLEELKQVTLHLVGDNELVELVGEVLVLVSAHDRVDCAEDVLLEGILDEHRLASYRSNTLVAR